MMERVEKVTLLYLFLSMDCGKQEQFACCTVLWSTVGNCGVRHSFCRVIWPQVRWQPLTRQITTRPAATTSIQTPNSFYLAPQMLTGRT